MTSPSGLLALDAEALYRELLRGVAQLRQIILPTLPGRRRTLQLFWHS